MPILNTREESETRTILDIEIPAEIAWFAVRESAKVELNHRGTETQRKQIQLISLLCASMPLW